MSEKVTQPKIFYGWFVVGACFAVTLTLGEAFWSFGVFFKSLENEFGWSRTVVSSTYTAFLLGMAISLMASGRLADRYSPRPILLGTAVSAGLGISLCSQVHDVNQLRLFLFIAGLGAGATWSVPSSTVVRWFYQRPRAGLALAIAASGVGVGAVVFAPLVNYFILSYGWRNAYIAVGVIFFTVIAAASLVVKDSPIAIRAASEKEGCVLESVASPGWTTGKVVITSAFVGITFAVCVGVVTFQSVSVHLVPHATDVGISPTASAVALGLLGGFSIPGRIASGFISDRIGWQRTLALSFFGMALSLLWLLFLGATWMLYCFVVFYGVFHGCRVIAQVGILGGFFGTHSLGELIGITTATASLIGAFAPYFAGFIFDLTGGYAVAFIILMVFLLSGGVVATLVKKPLSM